MEESPLILVVDDQPEVRLTTEAMLRLEGYRLVVATDGIEALQRAAETTPDLILLDVVMPGMDGYEVCERLRSDPHLAEVPIIMVTGLEDRKSRLRGIAAGADDFLSKPFDRSELLARVGTTTRLNRYRRLLSERARFEWVVQQAEEGYLVLAADGGLRFANDRARLFLGALQSGDNFLAAARRQYRLEPEESWASWPEEPVDGLPVVRYLVRPESETAPAFWLRVESQRLPGTDRVVRLRDVTAEVARERDTRGFHALIQHKLRTPLGVLVGGLELLDRRIGRLEGGASLRELSSISLRSAQRLRAEILAVLRFMNASVTGREGDRTLVSELAELAATTAATIGLGPLELHTASEIAAVTVGLSRSAAELVLTEILDNAKKFHPGGEPKVVLEMTSARAGWLTLRISDDGRNLSPQQLAAAWIPYSQGERYFTGEASGMGLGLSQVASVVWSAGGSCHIANRSAGPGVVVELTLPLATKGDQDGG